MSISKSQAIINAKNQMRGLAEAQGLSVGKFAVTQAEEKDGYYVEAKVCKVIQKFVPHYQVVNVSPKA